MSEINKPAFDAIPLGNRPAPDLTSMGLLPPMPKPTTPVDPRPMPKMDAVIDNPKPAVAAETPNEITKPPLPGKMAWLPEAMKAMVRPNRQKGVIAAGLASLAAGAMVANMMWPAPKPAAETAVAVVPKQEPVVETPKLPAPTVTFEEPVKLPPPSVTSASTPMKQDGNVKPAVGMETPPPPIPTVTAPPAMPPVVIEIPEKPKSVEPAKAIEAPALPAPSIDLPKTSEPPKPSAPTAPPLISLPETPKSPSTSTLPPPMISLPETPKTTPVTPPSPPVISLPETPKTGGATPPPPPAITLPETPKTPAATPPSPPSISLPETTKTPEPVKPPEISIAPLPSVEMPKNRAEPPKPATDSFGPPGTARPTTPALEPPVVKAAPPSSKTPGTGTLPPREDFDVDVHYATASDTWSSISKQHLGDDRYADALRAYNASRALAPNQAVDVPPIHVLRRQFGNLISSPKPVDAAPVARPAGDTKSYTTSEGMTFKELAKKALGDENLWGSIWELNSKLRADEPIPAGTPVKLPAKATIGN